MSARCQCGKVLKRPGQRLCGECSFYFKLWPLIRARKGWPNTREARYAWHELAGIPAGKERKKWAHGDYTRLFNWTRLELAGGKSASNLNAAMEAANPEIGERRELVRGIENRLMEIVFGEEILHREADERDAIVKEAQKYLGPILEKAFQYAAFVESRGWRAWRELPIALLRGLSITVVHRWRSKAAGNEELIVKSEELEQEPPEIVGEVPAEEDRDSEAWWEQEQANEDEAAEREEAEVVQDYPEPF